jgi:uncharacterized protein YbbC (DUF1343 family)
VDAEALADRLNAAGLPGVRFRPVRFRPTTSKHQGVECAGCETHILEPERVRPVATGVAVLAALRAAHPAQFAWRESGGKYSVDRLAGTAVVREQIDAGKSWKEISAGWAGGIEEYRQRLHRVALYG